MVSNQIVYLSLLLFIQPTSAFYLPGLPPHDYTAGDLVPLFVNPITSDLDLVPYDYYFPRLHFCPIVVEQNLNVRQVADGENFGADDAEESNDAPVSDDPGSEGLGSVLLGDRLAGSPFKIHALTNAPCVPLCKVTIPAVDASFIASRIHEGYSINWMIDGLPAAQLARDMTTGDTFLDAGFPMGYISDEGSLLLNNHYSIEVRYHRIESSPNAKIRIVGVIVVPHDVFPSPESSSCLVDGVPPNRFIVPSDQAYEVEYSYSVKWIEDPNPWRTRWDHYIHVTNPRIHWYSIINSITIMLILGFMVALILLKHLRSDILKYNAINFEEKGAGGDNESGWKLVHADVFRPPRFRILLAVLVGNGVQLALISAVSLLIAAVGLMSPSIRGGLLTTAIVFLFLFSFVGAFVTAILYKSLQGQNWRTATFLSAFLLPGLLFSDLSYINTILLVDQSSGAIPAGTFAALIGIWFVISVPLAIVGAYRGFGHPGISFPCKTTQIPRQIPYPKSLLTQVFTVLAFGMFPFGVVFVEFYVIMSSLWSHQIYYMFGFLLVVFIILMTTCALVGVLHTYYVLSNEDYQWSWRSFFSAGSSGLYILLVSMSYYQHHFGHANASTAMIFYGWTLLLTGLYMTMTGTIGYLASFFFVRFIYTAVKVD